MSKTIKAWAIIEKRSNGLEDLANDYIFRTRKEAQKWINQWDFGKYKIVRIEIKVITKL